MAKPGSFTTYLEYSQDSAGSVTPIAAPVPGPLSLLEILMRQEAKGLPLSDLQTLSRVEPGRFREMLKSLRDVGYVTVDGPSLEEIVHLTPKGVEAASLAPPA